MKLVTRKFSHNTSRAFVPLCAKFRIILLLLLVLLFASCSRSSDWVQFRGEQGRGVSRSRITPPLGVRWKIRLQFDDRIIRSLNPPVVLGNTIYFGSADGNFYALDVESGYMRWVFRSGAPINSIPFADRDHVYFGSKDGRLYALSRQTGEEVWSFRTRSQINSQVQRYNDYIIFVGDAEAIHFLSPEGEQQFYIRNPGWFNFTFLLYDNVMYFATGPTVDLIGPFDIKRREFLWFLPFHSIAANWYSFPAIRGDLLYFGTAAERTATLGFHAFNRHTGELVWEHRCEGYWHGDFWDILRLFRRNYELLDFMAPTVWRNLVIFTGGDRAVRAFEARTGELKWKKIFDRPISSAPTIAGNNIYFGILGNDYSPPLLVCLSARDGTLLWSMETEGALLSAPVIAGRRIIFGTDRSVFYVLEQVF